MVAEHPPFYLTSQRLLHYQEGPKGEQTRTLPLERITAVEVLKSTHHPTMVGGSILVISGVVLLLTWGLVTSVLSIVGGAVALVVGSLGRTSGYQIRAHNLLKEEQALWRLESRGSAHFVARIRDTIGGRTGF
jgi:hypothetical protein